MQNNHNMLTQQYLKILYQEIEKDMRVEANTKYKKTETHGEVLYEAVNKILSYLTLSEHDSFIDLGSGLGKTATQIFLNTPIKEAIGVEIIPNLHRHALFAAERMQKDLPLFFNNGRKLIFLNEDFSKITLKKSTVAFVNSTCFSQALLYQVCKLVEYSSSIHTVLSTRPLCIIKRFVFKKAIHIECSWDSALCYLYQSNNNLLNSYNHS